MPCQSIFREVKVGGEGNQKSSRCLKPVIKEALPGTSVVHLHHYSREWTERKADWGPEEISCWTRFQSLKHSCF